MKEIYYYWIGGGGRGNNDCKNTRLLWLAYRQSVALYLGRLKNNYFFISECHQMYSVCTYAILSTTTSIKCNLSTTTNIKIYISTMDCCPQRNFVHNGFCPQRILSTMTIIPVSYTRSLSYACLTS